MTRPAFDFRGRRLRAAPRIVPMSTDEWIGQLAWAWEKGHEAHGPVRDFGETPCDCLNPYRISEREGGADG